MDLSIIIVNWNVKNLLYKCLISIFKYTQKLDFELFIVDNNSHDGSQSMVKHNFPQVNLIQNNFNAGFAHANNQAIQRAKGKYILLLNPDTEFIDHSLTELIKFADHHDKIGILGPKLLNPDKSIQCSVRRFPSFWDQFFILIKLHNFFPYFKPIKDYHMFDFAYDKPTSVDQVMGAAMLIKRQVFDALGLLDEKFWLIFEEVDFCKRAKNHGYQIYFTPHTQLIHHKGESFAQHKTLAKQINFNHNLFYYFKKHGKFHQFFFLWLIQPLSLFLALLDQLLGIRKRIGKNKNF